MIICDDVLHWAETYQGEKFHALLTDAPYHLTETPPFTSRKRDGGGAGGPRSDAEKAARKAAARGFMGTRWDGGDLAFQADTWRALAQHLLPGAFGLCFGSARGWHRLACAIEDAGMVLHPSVFMLGWAYGSGWPKSTRIDSAIDKAAGVEQEVLGPQVACDGRPALSRRPSPAGNDGGIFSDDAYIRPAGGMQTAPATDLAKIWAGHRYGRQMMKPALEPIILFQVPYDKKPVDSIVKYGSGALWIDGARVGRDDDRTTGGVRTREMQHGAAWRHESASQGERPSGQRWPPHFLLLHDPRCVPLGPQTVRGSHLDHDCGGNMAYYRKKRQHQQGYAAPDGTEVVQAYHCVESCAVKQFDAQAGERPSGAGQKSVRNSTTSLFQGAGWSPNPDVGGDTGMASRFFPNFDWTLDVAEQLAHADAVFYAPKSSPNERVEGLEGMMQLRRDLTPEQRAYVLAELERAGVVP